MNALNINAYALYGTYDMSTSNVKGRNIRTKTWFLTQYSAQIDPISCQIKGYSFWKFEDNQWHSRIDFSLFSQQNLTLKHFVDAEIDLEAIESKRFKDCGI